MFRRMSRPDTPSRWSAALDRARREGVSVRQLTASGAWIATSTTDPHSAYEVSVYRCTSPALARRLGQGRNSTRPPEGSTGKQPLLHGRLQALSNGNGTLIYLRFRTQRTVSYRQGRHRGLVEVDA